MPLRYTRHYTRSEASALLPDIRRWLVKLRLLEPILDQHRKSLDRLLGQGWDLGGDRVSGYLRTLVAAQAVLREFSGRQIQVQDLDRGLVDFPALLDGREVFLCWEEGEEAVEYWHELDSGFAGRSPL